MSNQILPFEFDGERVRVVTIAGEPWFVAADVCRVLEIGNTTQALIRLDEEEVTLISNEGRQTNAVSESGLYSLVLGSRKPEARAFKRWITGTVLPEIRRTGSYGVQAALTDDQIVHQALTILTAKTAQLEAKVEADAPKVDYVETFVADEDLRLFRNVAKSLGMGEQQLRSDLISKKWIYEEKSTRWSEREQRKVPHNRYSAYSDKTRYFTPVPAHDAPRFRGEVMHTLKVTPAGAVAIARLYGRHLRAVEAVTA